MARKTKKELLAASMRAVNASQMALAVAKELHTDATRIDDMLRKENEKRQPDYITVQKLKCDRDWLLHQADAWRRDAQRYLKHSKKLSRRAWWRLA